MGGSKKANGVRTMKATKVIRDAGAKYGMFAYRWWTLEDCSITTEYWWEDENVDLLDSEGNFTEIPEPEGWFEFAKSKAALEDGSAVPMVIVSKTKLYIGHYYPGGMRYAESFTISKVIER